MIHGMRPDLICASCASHSMVRLGSWATVISQATAPSRVHGMCHEVVLMTSGETILRPAPHMPVKSLHRSQKPSRAASRSLMGPQHWGHFWHIGCWSCRHIRSIPRALVLTAMDSCPSWRQASGPPLPPAGPHHHSSTRSLLPLQIRYKARPCVTEWGVWRSDAADGWPTRRTCRLGVAGSRAGKAYGTRAGFGTTATILRGARTRLALAGS